MATLEGCSPSEEQTESITSDFRLRLIETFNHTLSPDHTSCSGLVLGPKHRVRKYIKAIFTKDEKKIADLGKKVKSILSKEVAIDEQRDEDIVTFKIKAVGDKENPWLTGSDDKIEVEALGFEWTVGFSLLEGVDNREGLTMMSVSDLVCILALKVCNEMEAKIINNTYESYQPKTFLCISTTEPILVKRTLSQIEISLLTFLMRAINGMLAERNARETSCRGAFFSDYDPYRKYQRRLFFDIEGVELLILASSCLIEQLHSTKENKAFDKDTLLEYNLTKLLVASHQGQLKVELNTNMCTTNCPYHNNPNRVACLKPLKDGKDPQLRAQIGKKVLLGLFKPMVEKRFATDEAMATYQKIQDLTDTITSRDVQGTFIVNPHIDSLCNYDPDQACDLLQASPLFSALLDSYVGTAEQGSLRCFCKLGHVLRIPAPEESSEQKCALVAAPLMCSEEIITPKDVEEMIGTPEELLGKAYTLHYPAALPGFEPSLTIKTISDWTAQLCRAMEDPEGRKRVLAWWRTIDLLAEFFSFHDLGFHWDMSESNDDPLQVIMKGISCQDPRGDLNRPYEDGNGARSFAPYIEQMRHALAQSLSDKQIEDPFSSLALQEDDNPASPHAVAFRTPCPDEGQHSNSPNTMMVIPHSPFRNVYDFSKFATDEEILGFTTYLLEAIKQFGPAAFFGINFNTGKRYDQSVTHMHLRLDLRYQEYGRLREEIQYIPSSNVSSYACSLI